VSGPRFLFVVGTGRCGSTLLAELLAAHPDVGHLTQPGPPGEDYELLAERISPILSAPVRDLTADDVAPWLERRVRDFFEAEAAASGGAVFLQKFTGWPRVGFLARIFPEARFVHVVRDGRAVASSLLQAPWWRGWSGPTEWSFGPLPVRYEREWELSGRSFALLAGLEWKLLLDAFELARAAIPAEHWLDVRYEELVRQPEEVVEDALAFAGLGRVELDVSRVSRDRVESYRDELSPRDLALLEVSLADHLARWGYGTAAPRGRRSASSS
jgi:hypothetical protein